MLAPSTGYPNMRWSDIPFDAGERMLKQFAGLCVAALLIAGVWQGFNRGWPDWVWALFLIAAVVAAIGWTRPLWLRPVFVAWMVAAFPIGWTVTQIVLLLIFLGLFTPVALIFRLMGRDALKLQRRQRDSHWEPKPVTTDVRRYFRQY